MSDIVQLYSDKSKTKKAYPKTLASETYMSNGGTVESQLAQIENKNVEQDTRLKEVDRVNKTQQVYINGLFNENKDGRLSIEGEGNSLKLEGSKSGLVEIDKIVGNTLVNLLQKDAIDNLTLERTIIYRVAELTLIRYESIKELYFSLRDLNTGAWVTNVSVPKTTSPINYKAPSGQYIGGILGIKGASEVCFSTHNDFNNYDVVVLEGDYTNKPIPNDYISGLQSSFESNLVTQEMIEQGLESEENLGKYKVPVKLIGKNLANPKNMKIDTFIDSQGNLITDVGTTTFLNIPFSPNTSYYISGNNVNRYSVACYNKDDKYLGIVNGASNLINISNINIAYGHVKVGYYANNSSLVSNVQIEEGTIATDYEDYFERTTNVYLNSPLLEGDEIVMKDGELCHYHKCIKETLTEGRVSYSNVSSYSSETSTAILISPKYTVNLSMQPMCDLLPSYPNSYAIWQGGTSVDKGISTVNTSWRICVRLPNSDTGLTINSTDSEVLAYYKNYIANNPLTVVYELAEPWYEPIQSDKLLLECANDSTLHIESIVPVEIVKASYTGNVPSVYAIEETGIINTEDISVTQTAVDFLLMSSMGEVMMMSFNENTRGGNQMGAYFASRIMKGALKYEDVIRKYPEFKDDIDFILRSEGYEHLIVEVQ